MPSITMMLIFIDYAAAAQQSPRHFVISPRRHYFFAAYHDITQHSHKAYTVDDIDAFADIYFFFFVIFLSLIFIICRFTLLPLAACRSPPATLLRFDATAFAASVFFAAADAMAVRDAVDDIIHADLLRLCRADTPL